MKGQDPLHIRGSGSQVRPFTYAGDAARGIRLAMDSEAARNEVFNISTSEATTVLALAEHIWHRVQGPDRPFHHISDEPAHHDTPIRTPDTRKARALLGLEATTTLDQMLDEVLPWVTSELELAAAEAPVGTPDLAR